MMGKKKPKMAETAGGSTPETKLKETGEFLDHLSRNGTKLAIFAYTIREKRGKRRT